MTASECVSLDRDLGLVALASLAAFCALAMAFRYLAYREYASMRRFRELANGTIEGLVFERDGLIQDVNMSLCLMVDATRGRLIGHPVSDVLRGFAPEAGSLTGEAELIRSDGHIHPVELVWRDDQAHGGHVIAVRELSVEQAARHQLQSLGQFDPLTGLGNKDMLDHHLGKTLALAARATVGVAVLVLDLDRFGAIVDAIGPIAADQIIIEAGRRLRGCVRDTDTIARCGPDAFAIIQPLADKPSDAAVLAERVVAAMAQPFVPVGKPVEVLVCVGVAMYSPGNGTAADLIKNAAVALRHAKQSGRPGWLCFEPTMDSPPRDRRDLASSPDRAGSSAKPATPAGKDHTRVL